VDGPWHPWSPSPLPDDTWFTAQVSAAAPELHTKISATFKFAPYVAGSGRSRLPGSSWPRSSRHGQAHRDPARRSVRRTFKQMWGALLVGVSSLASPTFSTSPEWLPHLPRGSRALARRSSSVAPLLGFIGVALSARTPRPTPLFGKFQALVGAQLGMPPLLLPTLNSARCGDWQADRAADRKRGRVDQ